MRTLSFGNMILLFLIIISSRTVLSNDPGCNDVAKNIEESLSSIETKVNGNLRNIQNSLTSLYNNYHNIHIRQESLDTQLMDILSEIKEIKEKSLTKDSFKKKQESLDTQLMDIHSEVKEIKEKSLTKESLDTQLMDILSEVKEIKEKSLSKESLDRQLMDILSEVKEIKEKSLIKESLDTQLMDILSEVEEIKEKSLTKESLDTQLMDILSEVKEIKEKSLTKDSFKKKQESLDTQLMDMLSEVKEIKEKSLTKVDFQDKQLLLETQLRDILLEVKEIKEKSFAKETTLTEIHNDVKHTKEVLNMKDAHVHSTNLKLKTIIEDQRNITGLLMDKHNVLNSEVKTVLSVVERLQEVTEDSTLKQDYKIVCYFLNWASNRHGIGKFLPEDIDPTLCTHLNYGFAVLDDSNLLIRPQYRSLDLDSDFYAKVTSYKKSGVKVLITIGGWKDSAGSKYSKLVNDPSTREKFNTNALAYCKKYGFEGINLDWRYPVCWQNICSGPATDKAAFASWVKELSALFHPEGMLVTASVSPNYKVIDQAYDVPVLSEYLDLINVITYDYHGHWDGKTGHISPLYAHPQDSILQFNTHYTINYWIQKGADPKKLIMGIPFFGRSFTLASSSDNGLNARSSGGGTAGQFTGDVGFLSYYEICFALSQGWTSVQDPLQTMGPYAYSGNQWVSYNDIPMVQKSCEYIREKGLGGAMVRSLAYDDFKNRCGKGSYPLLKTVNKALGRQ